MLLFRVPILAVVVAVMAFVWLGSIQASLVAFILTSMIVVPSMRFQRRRHHTRYY